MVYRVKNSIRPVMDTAMGIPLIPFGLALIALTLTTSRPAAAADQKAAIAQSLAEHLYCQTMAIASGYSTEIGLLVGLAISAAGFYLLIFKGLSIYPIILLLGGVVLTAMPGLFISGLEATQGMFSGLGASSAVTTSAVGWRNQATSCEQLLTVAIQYALEEPPAPNTTDDSPATQNPTKNPATEDTTPPSGDTTPPSEDTTPEAPNTENTPTGQNIAINQLVRGENPRISSQFNPTRVHPVTGKVRPHNGLDIAAPTGSLVTAPGSGTVTFAGVQRGYGNVVYVRHALPDGSTYETRYAHLSEINVRNGATISAGQMVGKVGSTGQSTGPHLHYELKKDGTAINPCASKHSSGAHPAELLVAC